MRRGHVVSIRLTGEEMAHLEQLADLHGVDKSAILRRLVLDAPLWSLKIVESPPPAYVVEARFTADEWIEWQRKAIERERSGG